ncbi:MAG: T9SS type A sorting domain-containing protein [Janthinobacterium lividum]
MPQIVLRTPGLRQLVMLLILLGWLPRAGRAQLYYVLDDGAAATTLDQLRRSPLAAAAEMPLTTSATNTVAAPGALAVDPVGNRVFIADMRTNAPKIVAVSLTAPYAVTTFLTPVAIGGTATTTLGGLAVDPSNGYLYYVVSDGNASTSLDQLRRSPLGTAAETTLASGFANAPGALALDLPNNRLFVADRRYNALKIAAVSLTTPYVTSTFKLVAVVPGTTASSLGGLAVDNVNNYLYYTVDDGNAATRLDELRRSPLSTAAETTLTSGFVNKAGDLALDLAGNRVLTADGRTNAAKVIALSLSAPYAASTLLTPAATAGASTTLLRGLALPAAVPLPVTLVDFTVQLRGAAAVQLSWTTASELNSARFEVERSTDGVHFAQLGQVAAAGTSAAAHHYGLLDAALPPTATPLYYRLRQVDLDGTATYSPVRTVVATASLVLYPNPTHQLTTLSGAAPAASVQVLDAVGRVVLATSADAAGAATLALPAGLASGVYVVRVGGQSLRLLRE